MRDPAATVRAVVLLAALVAVLVLTVGTATAATVFDALEGLDF